MSKQTDLINIPDAITVDGSNNVGIGTSSPTRQLDVSKAGTAYIRASDTANSVNMEMLAASSGGWIGTKTNHSLMFQTNNAERMRIDSDGLKFNGDTAAANALSDYEYGSWTPTTPNGGSATANNAVYTKIGDQVTVWCLLQTFTDRSSATSLTVKGLPFNSTNAGVAVGTCMCQYVANTAHTIYMTGSSGLQFYKSENGSGFVVLNHSDLQNSASQVYLMATYTAA